MLSKLGGAVLRGRSYIEQEGGVLLSRRGGAVSNVRGGAISSRRVLSC